MEESQGQLMKAPIAIVAFAVASVSCSSPGEEGNSGTGEETDVTGMAGAPAEGDGDWYPNGELGFATTNFGLKGETAEQVGDLVIDGACEIGVDEGVVSCAAPTDYIYRSVNDAYDLYVFNSLTIGATGSLTTGGDHPIIIAAFGELTIGGELHVQPGTAGGEVPDFGPMGYPGNGDDGGDFCGLGGWGEVRPSVQRMVRGFSTLSPLIAGRSGGNAPGSLNAGLGGGAIQLVAGEKFTLLSGGVLSANGGPGLAFDAVRGRPGGGGSGGAILIESPVVEVFGTLTATGGGGGAQQEGADGEPGSLTTVGARGGMSAESGLGNGGDGSSAQEVNGVDGSLNGGEFTGGGGGGAGRIRINSLQAEVSLDGSVTSPGPDTECFTRGEL